MNAQNQISFDYVQPGRLLVRLSGTWNIRNGLYPVSGLEAELVNRVGVSSIAFDSEKLSAWDSSILAFLSEATELCRRRGLAIDWDGLPGGLRRLIALAEAVPERTGARKDVLQASLLERIGTHTIGTAGSMVEMLTFLGEMTVSLSRLFGLKARFRAADLWLLIQRCGAEALPIVTLISFLVGVILAFVGAVQLKQFGAQIYVADLVGIAMMREMGAMMTAIIMAGRTGAAFAAQLGTMKVTQEIDAFTTAGFSPLEFLVLPRVVALVVMMPLLCLYADFLGVLGGAAIGVGMLDLTWSTYFQETANAIALGDVIGGIFKAAVYGVLIALAGCLRGLQCGGSSSAVGDAATSAVVTGIVAIIVACGTFAVVFYVLGI